MVDIMTTVTEDTTGVSGPGGSINGDGNRTSGLNVVSHGRLSLDGLVTAESKNELGRVGRAGLSLTSSSGSVRIVFLLLDTSIALNVVVGTFLETTIASQGSAVTLNQLLRGKNVRDTKLSHGLRLDLFRGSKGPARTTVALVLDRSGVYTRPVNQGVSSTVFGDLQGSRVGSLSAGKGSVSQVTSLELLLGQVRESGNTVLGRSTLGSLSQVTLTDGTNSLNKVHEASLFFTLRGILLLKISLELIEHHLDILNRGILNSGGSGRGSHSGDKKRLVEHID
jgi:hypothetical protein